MKKIYLVFLIGILLSSCTNDGVMDRTIFIPDENDAQLPAYTEWGYNSFGAQYERDYFLASNQIIPCKILYDNNQLQFSLSGTVGYNKNMTLLFIFPFAQISEYKDLVQLNNTEIDLSASDCTVKIFEDNNETVLNILEGRLYFKRAQLLSIDDKVNRVILSGTFELRFLQNVFPSIISNGRFDVGINNNVFYAYHNN